MIETRITEAFGLAAPILSSGMGFASRPQFAAAVSNAGGMGFLDADMTPPQGVADMIRSTRRLTTQPFGLDVMAAFFTSEHLEVCLDQRVPVVNFLWGYPDLEWVEKLQSAGSQVWMEVRSLEEAKGARQCGLDGLIVQAPVHGPGRTGLMSLLPAVVDAVNMPVMASGSIVDARRVAAALVLGAEAVRCGTLFLSAAEANPQFPSPYPENVASADQPFGAVPPNAELPKATDAALEERVVRAWARRQIEAASHTGKSSAPAPPAGVDVVLPRLSEILSASGTDGEDEWRYSVPAAEDIRKARRVRPVAEIVHDLAAETEQILSRHTQLRAVA